MPANISFVSGKRFVAVNGDFEIRYIRMYIDHFNWADNRTFHQKYLINKEFYKPGGPIFFYVGNEGFVELFTRQSPLLLDIAPMFNAMVVFGEHRYYGESMPFGDYSLQHLKNIHYLTLEQTLADFADMITVIKKHHKVQKSKVIVFGGSYGAMLAVWMRKRYHELVQGVWASSTLFPLFYGFGENDGALHKRLSEAMERSGCNPDVVLRLWRIIDEWPEENYARLAKILNVPSFLRIRNALDVVLIKRYIRNAFFNIAMANYPYKANYVRPMGLWPLKVACQGFSNSTILTDEELVSAALIPVETFYGMNAVCFKRPCPRLVDEAWGDRYAFYWQTCTEHIVATKARGPPNDVFWDECGDNTVEECVRFNCRSALNLANGDKSVIKFDANIRLVTQLNELSNVALTFGSLDPWAANEHKMDKYSDPSRNVHVFHMDGAAHQIDLQLPNSCDLPSVVITRYRIISLIKCWLKLSSCDRIKTELPKWDGIMETNRQCWNVETGFPWDVDM